MKFLNFEFKILVLIFFLCFYRPTTATAHMLYTSCSIGAVIHVDPEDDPIVGIPSSIYVEFKDKNGKFKPIECTCILSIFKEKEEIFSQNLFHDNVEPNLSNVSLSFTFPEKNIYTIKIAGNSTRNSFEPFILSYDFRVSRTSEQSIVKNDIFDLKSIYTPYLIISIVILIVVIILRVRSKLIERRR